MKKQMYDILYSVEDHFWWFTGLRKLYATLLGNAKNLRILDAGCGTGANLLFLKTYGRPVGIDISDDALAYSIKRVKKEEIMKGEIMKADMNALPFKSESFDLVLASDSLYHLWVDDTRAIHEFNRILKKNAVLIINTASYQFLTSRHDQEGMTKRRYTKNSLRRLVTAKGFCIEKIFYWNSLLFPIRAVQIFMESMLATWGKKQDRASAFTVKTVTNTILGIIIKTEVALLLHGFRFPFGLSIMCKARKR